MLRPKSAKPGQRLSEQDDDLSEQDSRDQFQSRQPVRTESQKNKNRMQSASHQRRFMNIAKPVEVATGEFTRIMPKHIYQDKERLYSEALQLKRKINGYAENMHGIIDENMKLKTKVAVLEREKEKLSRAADHDNKMYTSGSGVPADHGMITKLKKMLRDAQEEVRILQAQGKKLKKTVKYTKISELEVENKTLIEESIRLNRIVEQLMEQQAEQQDQQNRLEELEAFLKTKLAENEDLINTNKRLTDEAQNLEQNYKTHQVRAADREKKLQKDLDIAKRRIADSKREVEYISGQMAKLKEEKSKLGQPAPAQSAGNVNRGGKFTMPASSQASRSNKALNEVEILKKKNAELQAKVQELLKSQQEMSQSRSAHPQPQQPSPSKEPRPQTVERGVRPSRPQANEPQVREQAAPQANKQTEQSVEDSQSKSQLAFSISEQPQQQTEKVPANPILELKGKGDSYYEQQFEQEQKSPVVKEPPQKRTTPKKVASQEASVKYEEYKEDFAEDDDKAEEEVLYKKEEKKSSAKKKKTSKSGSKNPHKKELSEISELLTYRMKAQRYPFQELKQDIAESGGDEFHIGELSSMLQNSPFFLSERYVGRVLQYFFDNPERFDEEAKLSVQKLTEKLQKLIKPFELLQEEQEEEMDIRVAKMVTAYSAQLRAAFEQKRNGIDTISKADFIDLFRQLELQNEYIELIISRLALVSDDLEHLNYEEFLHEFDDNQMQVQEVDEEYEEPSGSRTLQRGMIQEEQLEESEESKRSKRREDKKKGRRAAYDID